MSEADLKDSLDKESKANASKEKKDEDDNQNRLEKDYQLKRAIDLLHGINIYQQTFLKK